MKEMIISTLGASLLTLSIVFLGQIGAQETSVTPWIREAVKEKGPSGIYPKLILNVRGRIEGEPDIEMSDTIVSSGRQEGESVATPWMGKAVEESVIFGRIKNEKRAETLDTVKAALRHFHAQLLEYLSTDRGGPVVIRIKVPDQKGQTCGIHALSNLLTVKRFIDSKYDPSEDRSFVSESRNLYNKKFKGCPLKFDINHIINNANKLGFSNLALVGAREGDGATPYTYSLTGDKGLSQLLDDLVSRKRSEVPIIVHTTTLKEGRHREHWTAASIVYVEGMERPVVFFMNSLSNQNFEPMNDTLKAALLFISRKTIEAEDRKNYIK